jgi:hypothetical protein
MPSTSKAQQQLMGMAYSLKMGEMDLKDASQEVKDLADSMTLQQLKDFAETKHEGLPDKAEEAKDHEVGMSIGQLEAIHIAATELEEKIGIEERDLPAWIQSHITSAYEYLKQANDNFHELKEAITPQSVTGMGATLLPTATQPGSGDVLSGAGDAEEEAEKKAKERREYLMRRRKIQTYEQFINESSKKILDYSNTGNKILVGLKTNLLKDMKDRYDFQEDGDNIHFFNEKGHHFGTLFDVGTRYQELKHDGSIDNYGWIKK